MFFVSCTRTYVPDRNPYSAQNTNPPGVFPICIEPITIRVGIPQNHSVENYETNALTKFFEEMGNFKLEFELFPTDVGQARQRIAVMSAGGGSLPEVLIGFSFDDDTILSMGEEGLILSLNEYIEEWGYYFPRQIQEVSNPFALQWMHSADGNIYYLPWLQEQLGNNYAMRGWINQVWLDNLGLDMPSTTVELRYVLEAFATRDPTGTGSMVIPAVGSMEFPRGRIVDFLLNAFIYNDTRNRLILDDNGRVDVIFNKPEYREGLRYVAGLMQDDLILNQSFTIDSRRLRGIIESSETATVGLFVAGFAAAVSPNNPLRKEYVPLPPLKGPNGKNYAAFFPDIPIKNFVITRSARNPEAIFRWGDLMTRLDVSIMSRFGIPGVDFRDPLPGEKSMYDAFGMPAVLAQILPWGAIQNSHWYNANAGILPLGICDGQVAPDNPLDNEHWVAASVPHYINKESSRRVDHLIFSLAETNRMMDIMNSINTFVNESQAHFVMGTRCLDREWDSYVRELDRIGLNRYLEILQSGFERAMGKK